MRVRRLNDVRIYNSYGVIRVNGCDFLFDLEDLPLVNSRQWYVDKHGYLTSSYYYNGRRCFASFHRLVMHAKKGEFVDHRDRKKFDNRRNNLRVCRPEENNRNRGLRCTNKSGVTGVFFDRERGKWTADISFNHKRIFLGRFENKEDAIKARLEKETELFGDFAPQRLLAKEAS